MTVLLQISDTHFGTERPAVAEALLQLAAELKPTVVVLSGDITQRARRGQFLAAHRFVSRITTPAFLAIPGNHDIPLFNVFARMFYPYAGFQRVFGEQLEPDWESHDFLVLCVNTTRPARHKDGEVSAEQIARVSQRLQAATPSQVRVVVTHQPVHVLKGSEIHNRLHGYDAAITAWSQAGADIIMGGHIHLPYIAPLHEHYERVTRHCWVVQAGTAVSCRVRRHQTNSVNVIRRGQAFECIAERWDYSAEQDKFICVKTHHLPLQRA
jgi:3',5'-cyclic AMP phosphodiesterase CpdA